MRRITTMPYVFTLLIFSMIALTGSALAKNQVESPTPAGNNQLASTEKPIYGPILSQDPATRILIMNLYQEISTIRQETRVKLGELNQTYTSESNSTLRHDLIMEMSNLKRSLEISNIEIGLEIARLNGQTKRADEFELALDQILNPENYFPTNRPDPALKAARLREHGQK